MNSNAIAMCLLLSVAVCDDKLLPRTHEFQRRQLPIPGLPITPLCGSCTIKLSPEFLAAVKVIGPGYRQVETIAASLRNSQTTDLQQMKANIVKSLQDLKDAVIPRMQQLSAGAATMGSCPALKAFFDNLIKNVNEVLIAYIQDWPSFLTGTDVVSITDAVRMTVIKSLSKFLTVFRDILFNMVQFTPLCQTLGPIIYLILDPPGIGAQLMTLFLNSGSSLVAAGVASMFGSFIPGNQALAGSLNLFEVMPIIFCAGLSAIVVGVDLGEATGGFCPAGSMGGNFDPVGLLKELLCRVLSMVEPSVANDGGVCAPGSSQGGNSPGLLCGIVNLLGLGGLLGCSTSGGSNQVQVLLGLLCEGQKVVLSLVTNGGGLSIPFCPLG